MYLFIYYSNVVWDYFSLLIRFKILDHSFLRLFGKKALSSIFLDIGTTCHTYTCTEMQSMSKIIEFGHAAIDWPQNLEVEKDEPTLGEMSFWRNVISLAWCLLFFRPQCVRYSVREEKKKKQARENQSDTLVLYRIEGNVVFDPEPVYLEINTRWTSHKKQRLAGVSFLVCLP